MKIVIATPILYDKTSPFNHLFKDIIGGFLDDGNQESDSLLLKMRTKLSSNMGM